VKLSARSLGRALGRTFPVRWWTRQSLRARLTLVATALFTVAVGTGAVLLLTIQRYSLLRVLDQSAASTAASIAPQFADGKTGPSDIEPTSSGVTAVQVVDAADRVIAHSPGSNARIPLLAPEQVQDARGGTRFDIDGAISGTKIRVLAQTAGNRTVLVATDLTRVDDSVRILSEAALIGGPLAVLLMAVATYTVVALTLRPVAALREGAAAITAAGLADQRLPLGGAQDEIHRLALTLNAMLDRIDAATKRQRTFVGDAAHELRSPLASLRVQLEVARRLGPATDAPAMIDDVLEDVGRLERLVQDLLALARLDERRALQRREPVRLDRVLQEVVAGYAHARVPVTLEHAQAVTVDGDADGLRRVAVNLIDNAVRYAQSSVVITLEPGPPTGRASATMTVTDDGPGVPPDERERVFDRFYRVNASRSRGSGGTGLGLPITRDLVRVHGGSVRLTTPPTGTGLTAVVVLPTAG
jgi:signal transduction histidine kinase